MNETDTTPRPVLQLSRTGAILRLFACDDGRWTLQITRLRQRPEQFEHLTADDALVAIIVTMNEESHV